MRAICSAAQPIMANQIRLGFPDDDNATAHTKEGPLSLETTVIASKSADSVNVTVMTPKTLRQTPARKKFSASPCV